MTCFLAKVEFAKEKCSSFWVRGSSLKYSSTHEADISCEAEADFVFWVTLRAIIEKSFTLSHSQTQLSFVVVAN